ncbi:hypothetical protein H0H92_007702 [Tricholoma furcatifolium]|nr:hypothetical protein H0H92_007702 [Tricholoma furcatifolium]
MHDHFRPLYRHPVVSLISFFFLFVAFLLFLLVALSTPIIKSIYILAVESTQTGQVQTVVATQLRFGVWGFCAYSELEQPSWFTNNPECYGPQLGYNIPANISDLAGVSPSIVDAVEQGLLVVLVLHPVAAGLAFLGFCISFFLASHAVAILSLIVAIVTAIVSTVVLAIDIALVVIVRDKILDDIPYNLEILFGPATWLVLASTVCTWIAVITLSARACYCLGVRRYKD